MNNQLLFLLSAIGGLNGIFLSIYFAFLIKQKTKATYFFSGLLLAVSVRITKSAFLHFNGSAGMLWFVQIGLIACALIGPFLYLYVKEETSKTVSSYIRLLHLALPIFILTLLFNVYPYKTERAFWNVAIRWGIYLQWFFYVVASIYYIKDTFKKLFEKKQKLTNKDIWLLNIVVAVSLIWLAYRTTQFTSYIVGALSFSFVFYISIFLWLFRRKQKSLFFETEKKYKNATISNDFIDEISQKLDTIFKEEKLFKNPNLKLNNLAEKLQVSPHQLSQFLNDNLQKSFNQYINEFRIEEAKQLLQTNHQFTLEAIGYEAGFSSKSTFYATFKKVVGVTPAQFRKQILA